MTSVPGTCVQKTRRGEKEKIDYFFKIHTSDTFRMF